MAKTTAKQNDAQNRKQIQLFRNISLSVNAAVIAFHFALRGDLFSIKTILCIVFFAVQEFFTIKALENHGRAQYGDQGQIVSCNNLQDTKDLGMYTYVQDLLWVCWATQVILPFSSFGWVIYLAVPSYGIYKAWDTLKPMFKKMMEMQKSGNVAQHVPPGHRLAPGYGHSRKEKRAAARQEEKDARNAEKAQKKVTTTTRGRRAARPADLAS